MVAVAELDVLGNSDSILGNLGHAKSSVENDIAAAGSESDLHSVSEHVTALEHESASISSEFDILTGEVHTLGSNKLLATVKDLALALEDSFLEDRLHHRLFCFCGEIGSLSKQI